MSALDAIVGDVIAPYPRERRGLRLRALRLTGIAKDLATQGCHVHVQRSDETFVNPTDIDPDFIYRGGAPTGVAGEGRDQTAPAFLLQLPGSVRQQEIWNGIQFTGRSVAARELDAGVVNREVGIALRLSHGGGTPTDVRRLRSMR